MHDTNAVEQPLKAGDHVRRTDTGRSAVIVSSESLFVARVQYLNGDEDWVSRNLLTVIHHTGTT